MWDLEAGPGANPFFVNCDSFLLVSLTSTEGTFWGQVRQALSLLPSRVCMSWKLAMGAGLGLEPRDCRMACGCPWWV